MNEHNIAQVAHLSAEPHGATSPVKVIYLDGLEAYSQWGSDVGGGGVLAWRAEHGDDAATPYQAPALTEQDFQAGIEQHIEATARARQYSSAVACASYAQSNVPAWQAEALTFIAWRDAVWAAAFTELAKVQQALREPPASVEEFLTELPAITWSS